MREQREAIMKAQSAFSGGSEKVDGDQARR